MLEFIIPFSLMALVIAVMVLPRYMVRRQGLFGTGKASLDNIDQQARVRNKMESVLVELQEINREVVGKIDTKFRLLKEVQSQVDDNLRQLQLLQADVIDKMQDMTALEDRLRQTAQDMQQQSNMTPDPAAGTLFALLGKQPPSPSGSKTSKRKRKRQKNKKQAATSIEVASNPESSSTASDEADTVTDETETGTDSVNEITTDPHEELAPTEHQRDEIRKAAEAIQSQYQRIYALADEGTDTVAIALEFGMQRGEVEFILRLRAQVSS